MSNSRFKAISVRQPWAWLLFNGKPVENRDWFTAYRGPLVILASAGMVLWEYEECREFVRKFNPELAARIPDPNGLARGYALGTVRQVDCVVAHKSSWFTGKWGHVYECPVSLANPIPASGRLGIFDWSPGLTPADAAQLRQAFPGEAS